MLSLLHYYNQRQENTYERISLYIIDHFRDIWCVIYSYQSKTGCFG